MLIPMKREDVLLTVIKAMNEDHLKFSFHALVRMKERNILLSDVTESILNSIREEYKDDFNFQTGDWKYAIRGLNKDGSKDIRLAVTFKDPKTIIITVIDVSK